MDGRRQTMERIGTTAARGPVRVRLLLAMISTMMSIMAPGTSAAPATTHGQPATEVWKTSGSVTFATADGANVWMIETTGGLEAPKAHLVQLGPGASRVITFPGYAYWPSADQESIYLVVDHDIVRVAKRPPHETKVLRKAEVWPIGTAVDGAYVYFTSQSTQRLDGGPRDGKPGSVARIKKDGSGFERLSGLDARNLALDGDNVYFSSETSVCAVSKRGGPVRTLVADTGQMPYLAIDGEWLVYTRSNGVARWNTKTGKSEQLATGIDIPLFVAAAGGTTYVGANMAFQAPGTPPKPAEILRLRPGQAPERLWSGMNRLTTMVLAAGKIYFTVDPADDSEGTTVLRIDAGDATP